MRRTDKALNNFIGTLGIALLSVFAFWWFQPSHIPNNFASYPHTLDYILFALVSYAVWHPLAMQVLSWMIGSHTRSIEDLKAPPGYRVAFITTFVPQSESIDLLHKTLPAMVAAHYKHDTWLLDEGNDLEVKKVCEKYGVKHFSRHEKQVYNTHEGKFAKKTKGGNHNSWYVSYGDHYDFVAQIDTDFLPKPTFLTKTLGQFNDPKVAFVGTPQVYGNTKESFIARGAAEQTYSFYGPILRGLAGMNSTMLIGANHVIRVSALQDVSHYSAHLTEDLLTGMKLHAGGWRSTYIPEALAIGEGPTSWEAYFNQQMRWAHGCIDILFRHSPKHFRNMTKRRRFYYYFIQQHYFSGLAVALSVGLLGLYFLFGINTASIEPLPFFVLYSAAILICTIMASRLQRLNIRPKMERGFLLAGKLVSVAAWPTFFLALIGAIRNKRLVFKVTPKGDGKQKKQNTFDFKLFLPHLFITAFCLVCLIASFITHNQSMIMLFWLIATLLLMLVTPFILAIRRAYIGMRRALARAYKKIASLSRFLEMSTVDSGLLPSDVSDIQKYSYVHRKHKVIMLFSLLGFIPAMLSLAFFIVNNKTLWILAPYWVLMSAYYLVSISVNIFTKDFDLDVHNNLVTSWKPGKYPAIDVFLPNAGEPISVLRNTWQGVSEMAKSYPGIVKVYCLDDGDREEVHELAEAFGYIYHVRPDRGHYKKAGNLRFGYKNSSGEFVIIFDADFRPRFDFLAELLPYFYLESKTGIVQSPQFFDIHEGQNWLERGAGAVQELFYRYSQVSRQTHESSICVGSNAIYRRSALDSIGGTALIEHSEDVHTGFNMRSEGWSLRYVPIVLAKGLCPADMSSFFNQQYRWCRGSMSLLGSKKFWQTKLSLRSRLSYSSGFLYYISTAINVVLLPVIPLIVLIYFADEIMISHYLLVLPSIIFTFIIFPLWHNSIYGVEAWAVRMVYGWAHLFAVVDTLLGNSMAWKPTGSKVRKSFRFVLFRTLQFLLNYLPATAWVFIVIMYMLMSQNPLIFLPLLVAGVHYLFVNLKVVLYSEKRSV